jgi:hypothetical protein
MNNETLGLEEINKILSNTLIKVVRRKISLKQAAGISKLAQSLTKNITTLELRDRVEFLENILKIKR